MKGKGFLALALGATMIIGSSLTALAADQEGGEQAKGELQYLEQEDIFAVVLPTEKAAGTASTFDYILDPSGLIAAAASGTDQRYTGTFESGKTVYFHNTDGTPTNDYSSVSDALKVINKSSGDVEVKVNVKVAEAAGVKMDPDGTFNAAEGAGNLYLALVGKLTDDANETTTAIEASGTEVTATIPGDASNYAVKWDAANSKYVKELKASATTFKDYTFKLTGSCKANDTDLLALKDNPPKIDLTWSVKDFTVTGPQVNISASGLITVSGLTADKNYKSMTIADKDGKAQALNVAPATWNTDNWTAADGGTFSVQLGDQWVTYLDEKGNNATVVVTLSDESTITCSGTVSK